MIRTGSQGVTGVMEQAEVIGLFKESEALLEGHFRLSSGLHSDRYLQCALVLQDPGRAARLGAALAERLRELVDDPEVIIAPALGGIIVAHEVARAFGVRSVFAERQDAALTLRRGFSIRAGERCIVVEDVVTTGGSTRETMEVARQSGGVVLAAGALVDRSGGVAEVGIPHVALAHLEIPTFSIESCPLCRAGSEAIKPGSR